MIYDFKTSKGDFTIDLLAYLKDGAPMVSGTVHFFTVTMTTDEAMRFALAITTECLKAVHAAQKL